MRRLVRVLALFGVLENLSGLRIHADFGYEPGTEAERRYREWYQVRYHRPQDDLTQPMDFEAAGKFNRYFYTLAETVADAPDRPNWTPGSAYAPKP